MQLFTGSFTHSIDPKFRVSVPRKVLKVLRAHGAETEVVLNLGLDGCLWLYPPAEYERLGQAIVDGSIGDEAVRALSRTFFSRAEYCSIDGQGRMLLPEALRGAIQLEDKVVFAGVGTKVELWRPDVWEARSSESLQGYPAQAREVFP